jgi:hypothetical protein
MALQRGKPKMLSSKPRKDKDRETRQASRSDLARLSVALLRNEMPLPNPEDMTDLRELPIGPSSSHSEIALGSSREIADRSASIGLDQPPGSLRMGGANGSDGSTVGRGGTFHGDGGCPRPACVRAAPG